MNNQLEELLILKNTMKESIILIIKEEWDKSKLGTYFKENTPEWIKEITPEGSHPMNAIADSITNRILNK